MSNILVVEDDDAIRRVLVLLLQKSGHVPSEASSGEEARKAIGERLPDLVLLDRMLPDVDGLEILRDWRRQPRTGEVPVIMLTARAEEADRIDGLSGGADDYVTKPFSRTELLLRIEKLISRKGNGSANNGMHFDGLKIDRKSIRVTIDDKLLRLGALEFRLLNLFASNAERVLTRGEIIEKVWSRRVFVDVRTVDVHVRRLRKALEYGGYDRFVQTVRGTGYRFSTRGQ